MQRKAYGFVRRSVIEKAIASQEPFKMLVTYSKIVATSHAKIDDFQHKLIRKISFQKPKVFRIVQQIIRARGALQPRAEHKHSHVGSSSNFQRRGVYG